MSTIDVDSVLWRFITRNDFKAMNGLHATSQGGSAKHIVLTSDTDTITDFFEVSTDRPVGDPVITHWIDLVPVESVSKSDGPIKITCKTDRRGGEWRIPDQDNDRYVLWRPAYGFPDSHEMTWRDDAYYEDYPPVIYFVKDTEGRFHARAAYDTSPETLEKFPSRLRDRWAQSRDNENRDNFGVEEFDGELSLDA